VMDSGLVGEIAVADWTEWLWGSSGSSLTSATGGRGVVRVDGVESWMGGDALLLNKDIMADKRCQYRSSGMNGRVTWDDESESNRTGKTRNTHPVSELREGC